MRGGLPGVSSWLRGEKLWVRKGACLSVGHMYLVIVVVGGECGVMADVVMRTRPSLSDCSIVPNPRSAEACSIHLFVDDAASKRVAVSRTVSRGSLDSRMKQA